MVMKQRNALQEQLSRSQAEQLQRGLGQQSYHQPMQQQHGLGQQSFVQPVSTLRQSAGGPPTVPIFDISPHHQFPGAAGVGQAFGPSMFGSTVSQNLFQPPQPDSSVFGSGVAPGLAPQQFHPMPTNDVHPTMTDRYCQSVLVLLVAHAMQ